MHEISADLGLSLVQVCWIWGIGSVMGVLMGLVGHVMRLRNVWVLCIATACVSGGVNGMLGYLPLYLRDLGWEPKIADSTLASFHAVRMLFAIPIALFSDRVGSRRGVLMAAALLIGTGFGFLGIAGGFVPPFGNWLARFSPGLPFLFWASLVFSAVVACLFLRQPGKQRLVTNY
jgi:cyanate permease